MRCRRYPFCKGCPDCEECTCPGCEECGDFHRISGPEQRAAYDALFSLVNPYGDCQREFGPDGYEFAFTPDAERGPRQLEFARVFEDGETHLHFDDGTVIIATGCHHVW